LNIADGVSLEIGKNSKVRFLISRLAKRAFKEKNEREENRGQSQQ
jgi:hypothetical protein